MCGWVKIHRQITDWEWYEDLPVRVLFMHLLLKASFTDSRTRGVDVPRGSLMTGINKLSDETKLTVRQIRTALKKLKSTNEVTIKSHTKFSIITISNYNQYQSIDKQDDKQETNNRHDRDYIIRKEKGKNEKNIKSSQKAQEQAALIESYTKEFEKVWRTELAVPKKSRNDRKESLKVWIENRKHMQPNDIIRAWRIYKNDFDNPESAGGFHCKKNGGYEKLMTILDMETMEHSNFTEQQDPDLEAKRREVLGL